MSLAPKGRPMGTATGTLALIDPLTLLGREVLELLPYHPRLGGEMLYLHTEVEDEHQIAELDGAPGLVMPLDNSDELARAQAILVATEADSTRLDGLIRFLDTHPEIPLVDLSRLDRLWDRTRPAVRADNEEARHRRIAHPALVATDCVLRTLNHLEPVWMHLAAVDPVSSYGAEGIELAAKQAVARLQGAEIKERIDDQILAFNLVPHLGDRLTEEAVLVFGGLPVVAGRTLSGCFHGNLVHIGIGFAAAVDEHEVRDSWHSDARIQLADQPTGLEQVVGSDMITVTPPLISADGRIVTLTAAVDGLRVGGAITALEVLESMLVG